MNTSQTQRLRRRRPTLEHLEARRLLAGRDASPLVSYAVDADWGSGFQSSVSVVNRQASDINGWTFEFDLANPISIIWNAKVVSQSGNHYVIGPDTWNTSVAAGASASFGFASTSGTAANKPASYALNWNSTTNSAAPVSVNFSVSDDWKTGFTGNVAITNQSSAAINGWTLEFDFDRSIDQIWSATIANRSGQHYVIKDAGYNASIAAGATVSFGFNGSPGNVTSKPQNYVFNGKALANLPPQLAIANATALEGTASIPGSLTFDVTLSRPSSTSVSLNYATLDGSARAGVDYAAKQGTLTFAAGETKKTVTVPLIGDDVIEPSEAMIVRLTQPVGAGISDGQAVGTIIDDDAPQLSVGDISVNEGDVGTSVVVFTVTLSKAATSTVTAAYATVADTATPGSDYQSTSGTLTFAAGQTSKTINVTIMGDTVDEPNERFFVKLTNPVGALLAKDQATGTILDDDPTPGAFNYGEALQKALFFYEAQRSGDLPDNYIVDWRGDAATNDGRDVGVDLTGGYWDAGDHVKFGLPMAGSMTLLAWGALQYRDAYAQSGQLSRILDAIRWGADYMVKAHTAPNEFWGQVGRGDLDHSAWVPPEVMQMNRPAYKIDAQHPGSDLAGEAAAALAAASLVFKATDPAYAALLLQHAEQLFNFADTYRGKYSDSITDAASYYNSYSGYMDELVWAGGWLYKATGKAAYLSKAESIYAANYANQTWTWTHSWDDKRYGAGILLAQLTGKDQYKKDVERWLDYWTVGINGGATRIAYTPGGLAFLNGWGSLRYAATTAFMALLYSDTVRDVGMRYHDFARSQIDYILGKNPRNFSYEVGFGTNYPQEPHHRGAAGSYDGNVDASGPNRHVLYGALVGGPESADDFNYHDDRPNYISNEVALDYNAGFTGALARLSWEYGGKPLASFPPKETRDNEFFVQASINQQGTTFTEIRALLNNRSAWPARLSSSLSFRYFVNLSELSAAGYGVNDVQVTSNYSQGAAISGLIPWDAATGVYYVEVSFAGVTIGPGAGMYAREAQLRIGVKSGVPSTAWNASNDWSYQGLVAGRDNLATSNYIPVYEFGRTRLFGQLPAQSVPGTPTLSISGASVTEGNSGTKQATFAVKLSAAATNMVTIAYATANGSATAGSDYTATSGTLSFAPGVTSLNINVPIIGDTVVEPDETFTVKLSNPTNAVLAVAQATGTILDDDNTSGVTVGYNVTSDWGTGFTADVTIANTGATDINDWTLEFDLAANITSIWNADIMSHTGNHYVIKAKSYNKLIAAKGSVSFGFQAAPTSTSRAMTNISFNGKKV